MQVCGLGSRSFDPAQNRTVTPDALLVFADRQQTVEHALAVIRVGVLRQRREVGNLGDHDLLAHRRMVDLISDLSSKTLNLAIGIREITLT
jgi:hypothetical protein